MHLFTPHISSSDLDKCMNKKHLAGNILWATDVLKYWIWKMLERGSDFLERNKINEFKIITINDPQN